MLDDKKRNIPRHRTRSELLASRKITNIPHMSFDVDMDGVVSPLDMKYSKAFDLDGDGILSHDELLQSLESLHLSKRPDAKAFQELLEEIAPILSRHSFPAFLSQIN